jgi:uncharacterized protein YprB with RNaseH-like and TPR domain/predicted nuclease with RNAse H fold
MIENTFQIFPGIRTKQERKLWEQGIVDWTDLENSAYVRQDSVKRATILPAIRAARQALAARDVVYFAERLPPAEHWRLYGAFREKALFVDIETTGLSHYYDSVTLIGAHDNVGLKLFLRDTNLKQVQEMLTPDRILVTYNGTLFDLKFIKRDLKDHQMPQVHIDLRFVLRSMGYKGGLKEIERKVGLKRPKELREVDGRYAVVLWNRFVAGDSASLSTLVKYNAADILSLRTLMDQAYNTRLEERRQHMRRSQVRLDGLTTALPKKVNPAAIDQFNVEIRENDSQLSMSWTGGTGLEINRKLLIKPKLRVKTLAAAVQRKGHKPLVVGLDLTGSEKKATGYAVLDGTRAFMDLVETDEELMQRIREVKPSIVSIDSPLSLPKGRDCTRDDCQCRSLGIMRECERELKRRGVNVYPCLIQSMQKLTARGIKLKQMLEAEGIAVIESYPGAAQDVMQLPRKRVDLQALQESLLGLGITAESPHEKLNHDEIDALTSALVGYFYLSGQYEGVGDAVNENLLIIPKHNVNQGE